MVPWFAYQARYLDALPQYGANGAPTAGGKINPVYPTFGLEPQWWSWQTDRFLGIREHW